MKCDTGTLGNEQHLHFDCPFVACRYAEYAQLPTPGCLSLDCCTTLGFMQKQDIRGIACFILACLKLYFYPAPDVTCLLVGLG